MYRTNSSQDVILTALAQAEGRRLRFGDLVKTTQLSQTTVSKVLKQLQKENKVKRQVDGESEEYPPPVYYQSLENEKTIKARILTRQLQKIKIEYVLKDFTKEGLINAIIDFVGVFSNLDEVRFRILLTLLEAQTKTEALKEIEKIIQEAKKSR